MFLLPESLNSCGYAEGKGTIGTICRDGAQDTWGHRQGLLGKMEIRNEVAEQES